MKALWAFEPESQSAAAIQGMYRLLLQFVGSPGKMELGFVITGNESNLYRAYDVPAEERFTIYTRRLIHRDLKRARVSMPDNRIHLVDFDTLRTTKAVDRFLAFARSRRVDLVALHTRSKRGIDRLVMGSFAETTVHRSSIDLLLMGPQTRFRPKVRRILFASDFSPSSKRIFIKVLALCKRLGADLRVFHCPHTTYWWSLDEANPKVRTYRRYVKRTAQWYKDTSRNAKILCDVKVEDDEFRSIPELILNSAKKTQSDLIVVSAETGPFAALMGGSVTRKLLRYGRLPILVLKRKRNT
jgi:nucleotide-binding universal stress UspA family protein